MPFSFQDADAACNFFELVLRHTQDEWYGTPFLLTPWQEEATREIFGRLDDNGNRLIEVVYMELVKKTGKTEWAAGLLLLLLVLDPNPGCQVYGAASSQRQAMNVYRAACKMVAQSPILKKRLRVMRGTNRIVKKNDPDSFYAAIAADGDLTDGVNPSVVVADELHRWRNRKQLENWDVLRFGGVTRRQTLTIAITTAGVQNESPLAWRLHEKTQKIRQGVAEDPHFLGRIYSAEPEDDWTAESTWIKANPSLKDRGGFLDISKIREAYASSLSDPDSQAAFKRYYLNLWDQKENRAIDMQKWHACHGGWRAQGLGKKCPEDGPDAPRPLPHDLMVNFVDRKCWIGADLSLSTDMSALALVFACEDGGYDVLPFYWMPQETIRKREQKDGMPYSRWATEGFLELCEGSVIDYGEVKKRIIWASHMFEVQDVVFDPWNSREISVDLIGKGFSCQELRQGFQSMSAPTKKLLELVASGKLHHGGHPVLAWNASCLCTKSDGNDNVRPVKPEREKAHVRIDGITSTINALSRATGAEKKVSIYNDPATAAM